MTTHSRVHRAGLFLAGLAGLLAPLLSPGLSAVSAAAPAPQLAADTADDGTYIVTLDAPPTATLTTAGRRLDTSAPAVATQASRLTRAQDAVLDDLGGPTVHYRLTTALNGFVAQLSRTQVKQLRARDDVALVERSTLQHVDSVDSPDYLGATEAWRSVGGPDGAGRGIVVGMVDTGLWPENPSFAGLPPGAENNRLPGFRGACTTGDHWDENDCNTKVVAARYFVKGFGADDIAASDYLSPRDGTGHGSHTASIAAGNDDVRVRVDGQDFGEASGMAPAARIAAYKACWSAPDPDDDGCTTADAVAAIDQAVADGVDVISYPISGPGGSTPDSVELAFLNATAAGVFVAASAGNDGPGEGTVAHASPWVTTVGASTHHTYQGGISLGDGSEQVGAMVSGTAVPETGIVLAADAKAAGASTGDARLCQMGALDAKLAEGKIVVCDRGTTARVDKSTEVARAGGVGMVLANVAPDTVDADIHAVPTVHLDLTGATAVKDYLAGTSDPTASIDPDAAEPVAVPHVAGFSSRGPAAAADGDLLKPDLTAPGVSVVAAVAPASNFGRLWDLSSGTSMGAAHVAGLAAFVLAERPSWSPAMVKSAMSTTARPIPGSGGPLAEGAGQVNASALLDPGLVFDETVGSYRRYVDGRLDASRLNLPSIAVGDLAGTGRVSRLVTNVSDSEETFSPRVTGLDGIEVTVRPRALSLRPGESARFALTFRTGLHAPLESTVRGRVTWTGLTHQVQVPVVVLPRTVAATDEVAGSGTSGSVRIRGTSGTDRDIAVNVSGLTPASPVGLTLEPGSFDSRSPADGEAADRFPLHVSSGTEALRVELAGRDTDDMDLYLYRGDELVAQSTGRTADETLTVVEPEAGDYSLYVHSVTAANQVTTTAQLYTWVLPAQDTGNLLGPEEITVGPGRRFGFALSWNGLDNTRRWFGAVRYGDTDRRTLIRVD